MGNKAKVLKVYPKAKAFKWGMIWEIAVKGENGLFRVKGAACTAKKAWEKAANKLVK
jgi:hypothetical protein